MTLSVPSFANPNLDDWNDPGTEMLIAEKLVDLQVCTQSLKTTTDAYNVCAEKHSQLAFWQTPSFVISGFIVSVSATATIMCLTHLMGACR